MPVGGPPNTPIKKRLTAGLTGDPGQRGGESSAAVLERFLASLGPAVDPATRGQALPAASMFTGGGTPGGINAMAMQSIQDAAAARTAGNASAMARIRTPSPWGPNQQMPATGAVPSGSAPAFTGGGDPNAINTMAMQAIRDANAATGVTGTAPAFTAGGDPNAINTMATQSMDDWNAFLTSLGGRGDGLGDGLGDGGAVVKTPEQLCAEDGGTWINGACDMGGGIVLTPEQQCAEKGGTWNGVSCDMPNGTTQPVTAAETCALNGGTWNGVSCDMPNGTTQPVTAAETCALNGGTWNGTSCDMPETGGQPADPYAEAKAQCALNNGMWNSATNTCTPIVQGAGAFDANVTVDPAIEAQAADQMSIVEKTLQQKNRSIQQALQAGLLSIGDAQTAWDEARSEIYRDFLTEQGLIQSGFATDQEAATAQRTTDREKLLLSLNAAGVDSGLVGDELGMIDEMFRGGATEQKDYLDAMGRIGGMSNVDRRMMGEGIFGGYEQDLRSGMRDLGLGVNFEGADQGQLARERALQARGLSDFTGVDANSLYAGLYAGVDVPGMAYGTSEREAAQTYGTGEREAGQEWASGESELDRALATDKFDESVRQFNWLGGRQDAATRTDISQWNQMFGREGSQYDTSQTQYQDALNLEAERYGTKREDIAEALGLEKSRFELGREMNPESLYAGMTTSQQLEHHRLTAKALASAGADVNKGSLLSQVASVMLLNGRDVNEIKTMMDNIDGYLEETFRGEDLSDENVLAALMSLGQTDVIMSVLGMMNEEQRDDLVETLDGGGPVTADDLGWPGSGVNGGPAGGAWIGEGEDDQFAYKEPGDSWLKNPGWFAGSRITIDGVDYTPRAWPEGLSEDQAKRHIQRKLAEGFRWENTSETWKK